MGTDLAHGAVDMNEQLYYELYMKWQAPAVLAVSVGRGGAAGRYDLIQTRTVDTPRRLGGPVAEQIADTHRYRISGGVEPAHLIPIL